MNELVRLETGVAPPLFAKVRWRSHPRYGLIFEHTFKLDELARISAPLQFAKALQAQVPRETAADGGEDSMPESATDGPTSKPSGSAEGTILRSL
jgi:hypothetical protein